MLTANTQELIVTGQMCDSTYMRQRPNMLAFTLTHTSRRGPKCTLAQFVGFGFMNHIKLTKFENKVTYRTAWRLAANHNVDRFILTALKVKPCTLCSFNGTSVLLSNLLTIQIANN